MASRSGGGGRGDARLGRRRLAARRAQFLGVRRSRRRLGPAAGRGRPSRRQGGGAQRLHARGRTRRRRCAMLRRQLRQPDARRLGRASRAARSIRTPWATDIAETRDRCLAAGAAAGAPGGPRSRSARGLGPARAHHQARHRGGAASGRRSGARTPRRGIARSRPRRGSRRRCPTTRSSPSTTRAATSSSRTTRCAASSPSA